MRSGCGTARQLAAGAAAHAAVTGGGGVAAVSGGGGRAAGTAAGTGGGGAAAVSAGGGRAAAARMRGAGTRVSRQRAPHLASGAPLRLRLRQGKSSGSSQARLQQQVSRMAARARGGQAESPPRRVAASAAPAATVMGSASGWSARRGRKRWKAWASEDRCVTACF